MKLVLITAVNQYKRQIQAILKNSKVHNYSYQDVTGHRDLSTVADPGNWFVGDRFESQSILFFAFTTEAQTNAIFGEVDRFNKNLESLSRVHISILGIEKTN